MKKNLFILLLSSFALCSCSISDVFSLFKGDQQSNQNDDNTQNPTKNDPTNNDPTNNNPTNTDNNPSTNPDENPRIESISFYYKYLDIKTGKYSYDASMIKYNLADENITVEDLTDEEKAGTFASSNTSVATVNENGKIVGVSQGSAIITYTTKLGGLVAALTAYISDDPSTITRKYQRVNDVNSIEVGDELIFASTDFNVAASINVYDGYVVPASVTFNGDNSELSSYDANVAEYYVGPSKKSTDAFTLETQNNEYLAGRSTDGGQKLRYSKNGKDQINWIIERPQGFSEDFIVSYDIADDYWLMFNKINDSDIRLNLYDSNETALMKKPAIYRKTIIR